MAFVAFTREQFRALDNLITNIVTDLQSLKSELSDGVRQYVYDWLDIHPEATTTVQDGSVTARKLAVTVTYTVDSNGDLTITLE